MKLEKSQETKPHVFWLILLGAPPALWLWLGLFSIESAEGCQIACTLAVLSGLFSVFIYKLEFAISKRLNNKSFKLMTSTLLASLSIPFNLGIALLQFSMGNASFVRNLKLDGTWRAQYYKVCANKKDELTEQIEHFKIKIHSPFINSSLEIKLANGKTAIGYFDGMDGVIRFGRLNEEMFEIGVYDLGKDMCLYKSIPEKIADSPADWKESRTNNLFPW